jgi:hypothetical protein
VPFQSYTQYLESWWQRPQQLDPDCEPDERGHGAVRDCGREVDDDLVLLVVDLNVVQLDHVELLERERVLGVVDVADQVKHLPGGKRDAFKVISCATNVIEG